MIRTRSLVAPLACALLGSVARAEFHDWRINEVFSNALGTVQFIEFIDTLANGEHLLTGHSVITNGGSITFQSDLPSDQTLNKSFLVGTDAFAALPGPNATPAFTKSSTASGVDGMLAPSTKASTPLVISARASRPVSSFCVAHGSATSHGTSQMDPDRPTSAEGRRAA